MVYIKMPISDEDYKNKEICFQKFSKIKEAEIKKVVPGNKDFKRLLIRKLIKNPENRNCRIREKRMNCTVRKKKKPHAL